eukprot:2963873-Pyramimonas_sp.AAC.1
MAVLGFEARWLAARADAVLPPAVHPRPVLLRRHVHGVAHVHHWQRDSAGLPWLGLLVLAGG